VNLVLATKNEGKVREFRRLLRELAPQAAVDITLGKLVGLGDVDETGATFSENARIKATVAAAECGLVCLGEDSGLEVDCLDGAPGVKSHRYSASGLDEDNNAFLLENLKGVPAEARTARYRCAICVASPSGVIAEAEGAVEGLITEGPSGENGFGYDPLFLSIEIGKTMGEATDAEKDSVSHRRRAMEGLVRKLGLVSLTEEGSL
jgi:XTP/dITP diphosphohydrolase